MQLDFLLMAAKCQMAQVQARAQVKTLRALTRALRAAWVKYLAEGVDYLVPQMGSSWSRKDSWKRSVGCWSSVLCFENTKH